MLRNHWKLESHYLFSTDQSYLKMKSVIVASYLFRVAASRSFMVKPSVALVSQPVKALIYLSKKIPHFFNRP
jgi:hypothetical protein